MANRDGALLTVANVRSVLAAGFQSLEGRKREINDLNVYPVPDGDTGTNLSMTMRSVVEAVAALPEDAGAHELCNAISQSALMGARGNSGVILSQIIRGAMEALGEAGLVTNASLATALRNATDTAYRAVRRPVEGTMLTVLREITEAAEAAPAGGDRGSFMDELVAAGWESVRKTPSLLKVLADAGVVDAGGYGLVVLLEGAATGGGEWETPIATRLEAAPAGGPAADDESHHEHSEFTYCVSFLVSGDDLDQALLEERAAELGDSLLVVGGPDRLKVHIHTDDPGSVISLASSVGALSEVEIDNMKEQTADRTRRLAEAPRPAEAPAPAAGAGLTQVVAVVAGEGNKALFRSMGVDLIVDGGQSMNPSTEDLLRAVERASAPSVVILPNNGNVIMTADQTVGLTERDVLVVPSRSIPAGLSAAVSYDKRAPGARNADDMRDTLERVVTGEVTRAVRKSQVDGIKIKADDFIGLVEDRVVVASRDIDKVVEGVVGRLLEGERIMLTALLGEGEAAQRAAKTIERLRALYPGVEVDVHQGGQPFYPVLLAAE